MNEPTANKREIMMLAFLRPNFSLIMLATPDPTKPPMGYCDVTSPMPPVSNGIHCLRP